MSRATTNAVIPFEPASLSTVAKTAKRSAIGAFVMKVFAPSRTYASPSLRAAVRSAPASLPAPGSESAYAPMRLPASRSGR